MDCPYCGTSNDDGTLLCTHCGYRLTRRANRQRFWAKVGITILVPLLVYLLFVRGLMRIL